MADAAAAESVATPAPPWQRALRRLAHALADLLPPQLGALVLEVFEALADRLGVAAALAAGRVVTLESGRRLAVGRVLGEGGYATVYLARDADAAGGAGAEGPTKGRGPRRRQQQQQQRAGPFALKRVADGGSVAAQREEAALRDVRGCPGVAELLEACRAGRGGGDPAAGAGGGGASGGAASAADAPLLLLFPAYAGGTLQEELERRRRRQEQQQQQEQQRARRAGGDPSLHVPSLLPARAVLAVAAQVAAALSHVHARGWVHRDVKPHNVMLLVAEEEEGAWGGGGRRQVPAGGRSAPFPARRQRRRAGGYGRVAGSDDEQAEEEQGAVELAPPRHPGGDAASTAPPPPSSSSTAPPPDDDADDTLAPFLHPRVVLIDFGSATRWPIAIATRQAARLAQEEAEAHVTATYRAPELFDVPSPPCELGSSMDVWALGCCLFACMFGAPPFEPAPGGSVALAVLAGRVPWPAEGAEGAGGSSAAYPRALVELVRSCLATDPARRPSAGAVAQRAREMLLAGVGGGGGEAGAAV